MDNPGIQYLLEQAGSALQQSHQVVGAQAQRIAELEAELADLRGRKPAADRKPPAKKTAARKR